MVWSRIVEVADEENHVKKFIYSQEDAIAESVLYRYPDYQTRTVICCSVQSGCPIGCTFCGSGNYFIRNLSIEEITSQITHSLFTTKQLHSDIKKFQIMYMSMGEPLLNLNNVIESINYLSNQYPNADQLVSTIGPDIGDKNYQKILELAYSNDKVGLQFSVHESTDAARNLLIPFQKKLKLKELSNIGKQFREVTGRKAFFNYCAHSKNSSVIDAIRLKNLFSPEDFNATVSVICEKNRGFPSNNENQQNIATSFSNLLMEVGFDVRVFDPSGQETIGGGCGQLWHVQDWIKKHPEKAKPSKKDK